MPRIVHRFCQGRVIKFGSYFYARLYLDGPTDADGRLTSANSVNVRFVNGAAFRLTRDPESFCYCKNNPLNILCSSFWYNT